MAGLLSSVVERVAYPVPPVNPPNLMPHRQGAHPPRAHKPHQTSPPVRLLTPPAPDPPGGPPHPPGAPRTPITTHHRPKSPNPPSYPRKVTHSHPKGRKGA